MVTVLPPMASFTITRALSGSTPSICRTSKKVGQVINTTEQVFSPMMTMDANSSDQLHLAVQVFMRPWLHQHTAARTHHEFLLLRSLLAWLGGALTFAGLQVLYCRAICSKTQTFWTELVLDWLYVSVEQHRWINKQRDGGWRPNIVCLKIQLLNKPNSRTILSVNCFSLWIEIEKNQSLLFLVLLYDCG